MSGWALRIDGLPYILTVKGVSSITSWSDGDDPGQTVAEDTLEPVDGDLSERLRPLEGQVDVSALSFVVHDLPLGSAQYGLSDLFTRRVNSLAATYLTASASASATTFTVADSSIFTSLPRKAWINAEVVTVTAAPTPTTITVTRAQYGTRAQAIAVSAAEAILPEIYLSCPWITRRRCVLYRVRDGAATVRWIGYADHAPRLNEDGASWTISATWAGQREMGVRLVGEEGGARTFGYDERAIRLLVLRDSDGRCYGSGQRSGVVGHIFATFDECLRTVASRLQRQLATIGGAIHVTVHTTYIGTQLTVAITAQGLDQYRLLVAIGDIQAEGTSVDTGSHRRCSVTLNQPDLGGLAYLAYPTEDVTSALNLNRYTAIATASDFPTDNASWTTYVAATAVPVQVTPILSASWDDQNRIVPDPRYQATSGTITLADTTLKPPSTTFKGGLYLRPTDTAARYVPGWGTNRLGLAARGIFLFRREYFVDSEHWLYALRWVLQSTVTAVTSDSRNWDWSNQAEVAGYTGGGCATAVRWRVDSSRTFGEFVADECLLRGATLSVRAGKIVVDAIRPPTAAERVVATITPTELEAGRLPQWEEWEDGLRTSVTVVSPMREVTVPTRSRR